MSSADQAKLAAERAARVAERIKIAEGKEAAKNHPPRKNEPRDSKGQSGQKHPPR